MIVRTRKEASYGLPPREEVEGYDNWVKHLQVKWSRASFHTDRRSAKTFARIGRSNIGVYDPREKKGWIRLLSGEFYDNLRDE